MKNVSINRWSWSRKWAVLGLAFVSLMGVSQVAAKASEEADQAPSDAATKQLVVMVNDLKGRASLNGEYARESLLRSAFADAAREADWLGDYDFDYNGLTPEDKSGRLEFNVIEWRRSPSGMYNFVASVSFWNLDGEKTSLGTVHGMRSSIDVFNRWDVGDKFAQSAEDAFRDALRKLKKTETDS